MFGINKAIIMMRVYLSIVALYMLITSRQKDIFLYSCEPEIDAWVKTNVNLVEQMSRTQIIKYNEDTQKAIYRAFKPNQRFKLWEDKLNEVSELNWTQEEEEHIFKLKKEMKEDWFSDDIKLNSNKSLMIEMFLKSWISDGMEKFGWSKNLIGSMISKTEPLTDTKGTLLYFNENQTNIVPFGLVVSCNCNKSDDWCPEVGGFGHCNDETCATNSNGCGTLWLSSCNGKCRLFD